MRVDHTVIAGTFSLDGQTFDVDNNLWVIGDDVSCVVVDAPHRVPEILKVVDGRKVTAVLLTHAHDDHVRVAPEVAAATGAPMFLHPAEEPLWRLVHPDVPMPRPLADGQEIAGLTVIHTPGHSPGAVCFSLPDEKTVFTGDTLFQGGPGATGRSYSDRPTIERSIREKLFTLPPETVVHTGHGPDTTIGAEKDQLRA
ncbi:MBL fold metallo-hydrolase [Actinoplanes sp. NPDC051411]|uniref:MBL fold metallo-hydrolase n=1 Tax=Actinoplanes sp. NPDC051411 TaxID=3155522 RepID=UPI003445D2B1